MCLLNRAEVSCTRGLQFDSWFSQLRAISTGCDLGLHGWRITHSGFAWGNGLMAMPDLRLQLAQDVERWGGFGRAPGVEFALL